MSSTIAILLAAWLVLNAAFITINCYVTADQTSGAEPISSGTNEYSLVSKSDIVDSLRGRAP
jgi:hypothetical protein